jgi:hypothetical protein
LGVEHLFLTPSWRNEVKMEIDKRPLTTCCFVMLAGVCSQSLAVELWSPATRLSGIYPHDGGYTVYTEYANPSLSVCGGNRFSIALSNPNYKALAATMLYAFAADKTIQMHFNDQQATCEPIIDRFIMSR